MTKEDLIRKLTSRKFWGCIATFVAMLMIYFGKTESEAEKVTSLIMAGAAVIAYIIGEGLADASGAGADVYLTEEEKPPEEEDDLK